MKIGGYKNNTGDAPLLDLSSEVQDTGTEENVNDSEVQEQETQEQEVTQEVTNEDIETGAEQESASESQESQEQVSGNTETEALENEVVNNESFEVSEELILKNLSEKLGREITSYDDLTKNDQLESDPYLKGLAEWRKKTNRPIEDWVKFNQDFSKLSDVDVAREFLQLEYPELSLDEINLELSTKFVASEDEDTDREMALKNLELKKYASKGRKELDKLKAQFGEVSLDNLTPEIKQDLEIAKQFKQLQAKSSQDAKAYDDAISSKANEFKIVKMKLAEGVEIDYSLPEGSSKQLVNMVQEAPHWKNADGSWNHEAVVRDAAIIANFDKMLQLAFEQGKNSGTDEVIQEAKNTTLGKRNSTEALPNNSSGVQIEGLDKYLGKTGMRIRTRN